MQGNWGSRALREPNLHNRAQLFPFDSGLPASVELADYVFAQRQQARIGLAPNLDLYAAAYWSAIGIPTQLFPAIFVMGRVAGWIAQIREQNEDNRLIRPRARYVGRLAEAYLPIEQRREWFARRGL